MSKGIVKFNEDLAIKITNIVGSMWCAWAFTGLALVSLPSAIRGGIPSLVSWIAQTFIQLVLLSIIMVGQKLQNFESDARSLEDHKMIKSELALFKKEFEADAKLEGLLEEILSRLPTKDVEL